MKRYFRPATGTIYKNAEELAEAIKKEKVLAKHLKKDFGELTAAERAQAVNFEPPTTEKPAKKKGKE